MRLAFLVFTVLLGCVASVAQADKPPVMLWLAPMQPHVGHDRSQWGAQDYFAISDPGAHWATVRTAIQAFKIYPEFAAGASDADLIRLSTGLATQHVALALEGPILIQTSDCTPGIDHGRGIIPTVERLKRLGIDLRYFDMNGPLVAGHTHQEFPYCHASIDRVAQDAAATIHALRKIYPSLQFSDIEPIGRAPGYLDPRELPVWLKAFQSAAGFPIAALHLDVTWGLPWRDDLIRVAAIAHTTGVPLGVIFDGDYDELSDAAWAANTERNYRDVEALLGPQLAAAVFQSWGPYPQRLLPEDLPTSMTGIILRYLRPASTLVAKSNGHVSLADATGAPLRGAEVVEEEADADPRAPLAAVHVSGTVPGDAVTARVALRVNSECACADHPTHLTLGRFELRQPDAAPFRWDMHAWASQWPGVTHEAVVDGQPVTRLDVEHGENIVFNGPEFPVRPNTPFDATIQWKADAGSERTGFVAIIFADAHQERHRVFRWIGTTWRAIARASTDTRGVARFPDPVGPRAGQSIRFTYAGDDQHRPAATTAIGLR